MSVKSQRQFDVEEMQVCLRYAANVKGNFKNLKIIA